MAIPITDRICMIIGCFIIIACLYYLERRITKIEMMIYEHNIKMIDNEIKRRKRNGRKNRK